MKSLKKFVLKKPKVKKVYNVYNFKVKSKAGLRSVVLKNSRLKNTISALFSKKGLYTAAGVTAVGLGISKINDYIQANSGCFMRSGEKVCKVDTLSCCQPKEVEGMEICPHIPEFYKNTCEKFDEDKENSCCRLCDCETYGCLPGQKMECNRPTVGEALSYFAQGATISAFGWMTSMIPWWLLWGIGGLIAFIVINYIRRII